VIPQLKKLPNGLRLLLVSMKEQRTATVLVLVEAGSKYETKGENGISHFLEHMCFKGTTGRPSQLLISQELEGLGMEYNAFTGMEYTGYYAKARADYLPRVVDLLADIYCNPLFRKEDIDQEREAIKGEIAMYEDVPMRKVQHLFMKVLYGEQPAGREILGPKAHVEKFTREDFLLYRKVHYVPAATVVVVAGKFDPAKTEKLIREKFDGFKRGKKKGKIPVDDRQRAPKVLVEFKKSDQTHLILGVRSYSLTHKYHHTAVVLAAILGSGISSRLFQKVRTELGLGYYVNASHDAYTDHGLFAASAGVTNERAQEAVVAILCEFKRLKDELVSSEELKKVKDMISGRLVLGLESSDELAEFYGFQEILKKKTVTPEGAIQKIASVTAKDVQKVAMEIFVTGHLNLALIGPWKDERAFQKLLKF